MFEALQILTVMLVALSAATSLAHALELPGKMRLDEQRIGPCSASTTGLHDRRRRRGLGRHATALLVLLTPVRTAAFWLVFVAFIGMLAMHIVYWIGVHPVNKHWMTGQSVSAAGAAFFGAGRKQAAPQDWTALRDRWEYGHVARAVLAGASLLALVISLTSD